MNGKIFRIAVGSLVAAAGLWQLRDLAPAAEALGRLAPDGVSAGAVKILVCAEVLIGILLVLGPWSRQPLEWRHGRWFVAAAGVAGTLLWVLPHPASGSPEVQPGTATAARSRDVRLAEQSQRLRDAAGVRILGSDAADLGGALSAADPGLLVLFKPTDCIFCLRWLDSLEEEMSASGGTVPLLVAFDTDSVEIERLRAQLGVSSEIFILARQDPGAAALIPPHTPYVIVTREGRVTLAERVLASPEEQKRLLGKIQGELRQ